MISSGELSSPELANLVSQLSSARTLTKWTLAEDVIDKIVRQCEKSPSAQLELGTTGAVREIFELLTIISKDVSEATSGFGDNHSIVAASLHALTRLCRRTMDKTTSNASNIAEVESTDLAFEILAELTKASLTNEEVALYTCWLVMILASDSAERQFKLVSHGFHQVVIEIMQRHVHREDIAEMSCRAIRNIAAAESDVVAKLVEDGVCESLVSVLRYHKEHPVVAEAVLWAVVNLSCEENVATILGSVGMIECVVEVSRTLINHLGVTLAACSAIRNLSTAGSLNFSLFAHTEVSRLIPDILLHYCGVCGNGEAEAVVVVRGAEADDSSASDVTVADEQLTCLDEGRYDVAETALWGIANLACDQKLSGQLGENGAADVITATYNAIVPKFEPEVVPAGPISEATLWAIINLASSGLSNQQALGQAGAIVVVAKCLKNYQHREGMLEVACNAFYYLVCACPANVSKVTEVDGLFASVIQSMQAYIESDDLCETALKFLAECVVDHPGTDTNQAQAQARSQLVGLNAPKIAVQAATGAMERKQRPAPEILRLTCDLLLQTLYRDSPSTVERLRGLAQLTEDGRAKPNAGSFEDVVAAWDFASILSDNLM